MTSAIPITTLFLDIGGVLLTDGWDHHARQRAATHFKLDWDEMENRHQLTFGTYEEGKLTLEEYLSRTVFYEKRPFTRDQFREFMFAQSQPYPEMIELFARLKARHRLKIAVVSNEARELNAHRIRTFKLDRVRRFLHFFLLRSLSQTRCRTSFGLALDIAQTPAEQIVYIENTAMFVQIAEELGDSRHSSHRLHVHLRETGCVRIAD